MWFFIQLRSSWQDFNWHSALCSSCAVVELLVLFPCDPSDERQSKMHHMFTDYNYSIHYTVHYAYVKSDGTDIQHTRLCESVCKIVFLSKTFETCFGCCIALPDSLNPSINKHFASTAQVKQTQSQKCKSLRNDDCHCQSTNHWFVL